MTGEIATERIIVKVDTKCRGYIGDNLSVGGNLLDIFDKGEHKSVRVGCRLASGTCGVLGNGGVCGAENLYGGRDFIIQRPGKVICENSSEGKAVLRDVELVKSQ